MKTRLTRTAFPGVESEIVRLTFAGRLREYLRQEELLMRFLLRHFAVVVLAAAVGGAVFVVSGCEGQVRYYDAGYNDYHVWNHGEVVNYNRWEHETHRDHVDFAKRNDDQKKEYFAWRHNQH